MTSERDSDRLAVFISYAHDDNESDDPGKRWLNRLLEQLQPLVLQDRVKTWSDTEIKAGERWDEAIKEQLRGAKGAVLLVSPAFLASEYIRNSELPVLLMNAMEEGTVVVPVILRHCLFAQTKFKYPDPARGPRELSLSVFQSANPPDRPLNSLEEHEQDAVLLSVAQRILEVADRQPAPAHAAPAQGGAAVWTVPLPRNPFFTGREQVLEDLRRALSDDGRAALSGLGGVGKTQTAAEYAYRHRGEYDAVLWARADSEESLKANFAALASKLNLPEKDEKDRDVIVAAVKRWLERREGWLLILDNADELGLVSDLLRREWGGHVLLTTRAHATGGVARIEISEMMSDEGTLFLLRRSKLIGADDELAAASEADRALAGEIAREVGGLPLALDQAGAFIEEGPSSLAEYLELYREEGAQLRAARGGFIADHEPVTITFSLAFRQVEAANAAAADLLRACAFLAPDAIPEEVFTSGAKELGGNLSSAEGGGLALVKILGVAGRFSLIRRNTRNGTVSIHRLVQQVLKDEMTEEDRRLWAERAICAQNATFPWADHKNWPLCEKLLPHALEAARLIEKYGLESFEAAHLLNKAGSYCWQRAQYAEARTLFMWAVRIFERVCGPEHSDLATSLNNLATTYKDQGMYAEAVPLLERALTIFEETLGPDDPKVGLALNNLGNVYSDMGKYAQSEPLHQRSLAIREKALGPDHPDVAVSLNNLAILYYEQGRYAEAEPLFARALSVFEKALGPDHPNVAYSLTNLASLLDMQDRYAEAEPLFARALGLREKALGPDHPDLATTLNNLASLYRKQGKHAEAEPLFARALNIWEKVLGPEHPRVATSLNNLAGLYIEQARYADSEPPLMRALSIREKTLGPDHPDVALSLNSLSFLYYKQGRYKEAEPLCARALSIVEKALGPDHHNTITARENYAELQRLISEQS